MALATVQTPPSLQEAARKSTTSWQIDLESLFHHAKDRFPDVVWDVIDEDDSNNAPSQLVYGHKAIVYARAPPSFQNRYFALRPNALSPLPFSGSPAGMLPANSALSLPMSMAEYDASRSPSPFRSGSPSPSTNTAGMLRLTTSINPALFSNELEYLYTGKGFGEAFEFLFDSTESHDEGDAEEQRIDKLRKDLVFMWRSRLYSDVRLELTGTFSSTNHESSSAIFSTHRFILVSRSPYFFNVLSGWGGQPQGKPSEPLTLTLPSPPFTPPSLHFILGFIYTGTLVFSHRSYDLDTAFHILRSATYLSLQTLYDEIQARIVQEMMHGLFHAFLEFSEYERITGSKWGTGGCRCRQCARRMPRILEFAIEEDVKNPHLERGARRGLVGLFGEGWCNSEFSNLDPKHRDNVLRGLGKRTTPVNIFPLLFASQHALTKLSTVIDAWADIPRDMIHTARKTIFEVLCNQAEECFEQPEWLELMEADGVGFDDADRVDLIMDAVKEGLTDKNAPMVYQILVASILIRPHPTENDATMLPATSHVRVQVEQTRVFVLKWIGRRWLNIRQEGGFDNLEGWAAKEISHDIEVPVEELYMPVNPPRYSKAARTETQSDVASVHSLRSTVLKGSSKRNITPTKQGTVASSGASIRSVARSTISTHTTNSVASRSTVGRSVHKHSRPDSKLTSNPSSTSLSPNRPDSVEPDEKPISSPVPKTLVTNISRQSTVSSRASTASTSNGRPKSLAPSVKSHASTIRTERNPRSRQPTSPRVVSSASMTSDTSSVYKSVAASPTTLRPPSTVSRSTSATSSDGSTTFKTANTEARSSVARSRRLSSGSTTSNLSVRTTGPAVDRARRTSATSTSSAVSAGGKPKRSPTTPLDPNKLSPIPKSRAPSVRSTASTRSTASKSKGPVLKPSPSAEKKVPLTESSNTPKPSRAVSLAKGKGKQSEDGSTVSSAPSTSTIKRKGSADTITKRVLPSKGKAPAAAEPTPPKDSLAVPVQGATLEIGIPCIVSLKRKRFKAYARYIGEVEGESGPWVGIEVPMVEGSVTGKLDSRQWNDGSWGGIRYFDIGSAGSEWEFGDDRAPRRRRLETSISGKGTKREGDTLHVDRSKRIRSVSPSPSDTSITESRGLFVRPQNVLFVMGADD